MTPGDPTGLLEDAAFDVFSDLIPKPTPEENIAAAKEAQQAMLAQGVTSFLDAAAAPESMTAFTAVQTSSGIKVRAHFAPVINPPKPAVPPRQSQVVAYRKQYDQGALQLKPGITVRNAKLFLDGVIAAPALTGAVLEPYRKNVGTQENPNWVDGDDRGPAVYFRPRLWQKLWFASAAPALIPTCTLTVTSPFAPASMRSKSCAKNCAVPMSVPPSRTTKSSAPRTFPASGRLCAAGAVFSVGKTCRRHTRFDQLLWPGAHEDSRACRPAESSWRASRVWQRLARRSAR